MHLKSKDQALSRDLVAGIMADKLGHDETLTKHMIPQFALGCRRMTPGSGYLESLRADNVEVVPKSAVRMTEKGVVDESGTEHEVDAIVCATGFTTTFTPHFETYGRNGAEIHKQFGDFPVGYMGVAAENFPNLFRTFSMLSMNIFADLNSLSWTERAGQSQLHTTSVRVVHTLCLPSY